jgi:hypothetical protein
MKKYCLCVFLAALFLAFLGCDIGFSHPYEPLPANPPPTNPPATGLPVKTIFWEWGTDGLCQYYTNDQEKFNSVSSSHYYYNRNNPNVFEFEIKKVSGARGQPYGMILGAGTDNWYCVNIFVDGYYEVIRRLNGSFETAGKRGSSSLRVGYNAFNTIRVTKSGSNFQINFNGSDVASFTDSSVAVNAFGALAWVGSRGEESFPDTPVELKFRLTGQ